MNVAPNLCLQVCEEKLQYSLSENVKTNVLWGSTVTDSIILHPWGENHSVAADEAAGKDSAQDNKGSVSFSIC